MKKRILFLLVITYGLLITGFAQDVKLMLPIGHTDDVQSTQISPDGKRIVTASVDKTAKVWDAEEGKLLFSLEGHTGWVFSAQFSPDGKKIVTASWDSTANVWDAETGKLLFNLKGSKGVIYSARYSPDGKRIVTASWDRTAKVWDTQNGKLLLSLEGHTDAVKSAQFSPDGKRIATASEDSTTKVWDVETGNLLFSLKGYTQNIDLAQFSPDGKRIVTISWSNANVWDAENGKLLFSLGGHANWVVYFQFSPNGKRIVIILRNGTAHVWDAETGKFLVILEGSPYFSVSAQFSPDGKRIVIASNDYIAKVWDAETGKLLFSMEFDRSLHFPESLKDPEKLYFSGKLRTVGVKSFQFSPNGKRIVTASYDKSTKVWDTETGKLLVCMGGHTTAIYYAQFAPDRKRIVTCSSDNTAKVWDAETGKLLFTLGVHAEVFEFPYFSPNGKRIVTASVDHIAKVWDAETGKLMFNLGWGEEYRSAQFSPDGKRIVIASDDQSAKVWNAETWKLMFSLEGHTGAVNSAQFSPDGKRIVTSSLDSTAKVWDAETGNLLFSLDAHTVYFDLAQFSPDGKKIVTASRDNTAKVWNAESGKLLFNLEGHTYCVRHAEFSPDGKRIVTASDDKKAKVWDAETGKLLFNLEGHTGWVYLAQFSPDGKKVATSSDSEDRTVKIWDADNGKLLQDIQLNGEVLNIDFENNRIISHNNSLLTFWDINTGKELYSWVAIDSNDYLVKHPDGYYDGTEAAREYLYYTCGTEIIDLAQMKDALYVPGLVEKIISGQDINYPKLSDFDICGTLPLIERDENEKLNFHYKITPRKLGLEYVEVYVNEKKIYTYKASELIFVDGNYYLKISNADITKHFVPGNDNKVNVVGIVKQGNSELRSRGVTINFQAKEESRTNPKLYAVMIGINEYKDPTLNLRFPVKDATDFGKSLGISAKLLLGEENVVLYYVHSKVTSGNGFTTPEKEGIRRTLADIGKKAKPEDVILIFFAGHGVMQGEDKKKFMFLTADASKSNPIGINTKELQEWLSYTGPNKILANKTILIFDACNSGQATQDLLVLARDDNETQRIRQVEDLKDKSGMFILAGSAPNQSAYELPQYEQGLLTYSLLYILKNNPDILDDAKYLNVQKWFLESEKYLHQLVESLGYKQDAQPFGTANIRIGVVDEDVRKSINLAAEKPVVMCANVLNGNSFVDDLQLKEMINNELSAMCERGTNSPLAYSRQETASINKINILYQVEGDILTCEVRLVKGNELLQQARITGNKNDLVKLVKNILAEVAKFAK